jgi:hypothetical protein
MMRSSSSFPTDSNDTAQLRNRIRDLELAVELRNESLLATFRLPTLLNNLLGLLLNLPAVTPEVIHQRLEIAHEPKVAVWRLRKHLAEWCEAHGIPEIKIESRRHFGYWLEDDAKLKIRELMAATLKKSPFAPQVIATTDSSPTEEVVEATIDDNLPAAGNG